MNAGTYYLYEYKNNQKLRNTGFLKITKQFHSCYLQLNVCNIAVTKQDILNISAFFIDNDKINAKQLSEIFCDNHKIMQKITLSESLFPNASLLEQIDGFFLVLPHGEVLVAAVPEVTFDTRNIHYLPEPIPSNTEEYTQENETAEVTLSAEESKSDEAELPAEENKSDEAELPAEENKSDEAELPAEENKSDEAELPTEENKSDEIRIQKSIHKIQRSDIARLPRRHWNIANNSFLLHGYYNYNHLLLIEEDGHYWLGVPGIYDPRESRAAELFGFSQFTDSYNSQLSLSEEECNTYGRFGYWCRYLK